MTWREAALRPDLPELNFAPPHFIDEAKVYFTPAFCIANLIHDCESQLDIPTIAMLTSANELFASAAQRRSVKLYLGYLSHFSDSEFVRSLAKDSIASLLAVEQ